MARLSGDVDAAAARAEEFAERYNSEWLIAHGHRSPRDAYQAWLAAQQRVA